MPITIELLYAYNTTKLLCFPVNLVANIIILLDTVTFVKTLWDFYLLDYSANQCLLGSRSQSISLVACTENHKTRILLSQHSMTYYQLKLCKNFFHCCSLESTIPQGRELRDKFKKDYKENINYTCTGMRRFYYTLTTLPVTTAEPFV